MDKNALLSRLAGIQEMSENVTSAVEDLITDVEATNPEPEPIPDGKYDPPPSIGPEIRVPEDCTLVEAVNRAEPGQHISLGSKNYTDDFTFNGNGADGKYVVIKAREQDGAVFTGRLTFAKP